MRETVRAVGRADSENRYVLFADGPVEERLPGNFELRAVETGRSAAKALRHDGRRSLGEVSAMTRVVAGEDLDLIFFPSVFSYFPVVNRANVVVGIHDTIAEKNPRFAFDSKKNELLWRGKVKAAITQADVVVTVSEYSRACLEDVYGLGPDLVEVVPEAAAEVFTADAGVQRERLVLYAGGVSPNKNLENLVKGFELACREAADLRLVVAGDYEEDPFKSSYSEIRRLADGVEFTGYVSDDELADLYRRAAAFVMPSWDEGFGLPAVEAMACGAPVAVSRGHALEEVVGMAGLLFAPDRPEEIAARILEVTENRQRAEELSRRSLERAAMFSWDASARRLISVFEGLC